MNKLLIHKSENENLEKIVELLSKLNVASKISGYIDAFVKETFCRS